MRMNVQSRKVAASKRPTNVSLRSDLIDEARKLGINISEACEQGLRNEVARTQAEQWLEKNRAAIESSNAYVERHGLPLARYRRF